jgi:hypothetical protein
MEFLDLGVAHFVLGGLVMGGLRPFLLFARRRKALPAAILSLVAIAMMSVINIARGFVLPALLIFLALSLAVTIPRSFVEIAAICFISTISASQLLDDASSLNHVLRYTANNKDPFDPWGNSTTTPSSIETAPFHPVWNANQLLLGLRQGSSMLLKNPAQLHDPLTVNFDRIRIQGDMFTSDWVAPTSTSDGRTDDSQRYAAPQWTGTSLTLPRLIVFGDHFQVSNLTIALTSFGTSAGKVVIRGQRGTMSNVFIHLAGGWTETEPPLLIQEGTTLRNVVLVSSSDVKGQRLDVENCKAVGADGPTAPVKGYRCFSTSEIPQIEPLAREPIPFPVRCREVMPESLVDATTVCLKYLQDEVLPTVQMVMLTLMQTINLMWRSANVAMGDVFCGVVRGGDLQKWEKHCVQRLQKMAANNMRNQTSSLTGLASATVASASAAQPQKLPSAVDPSGLEETVRILTIALMKVGAPVLYHTVQACVEVEVNAVLALTSVGLRALAAVGGWLMTMASVISPLLPDLHLQDRLVQLAHLVWNAYVSYLVWFLTLEKEVARWFFFRLLDIFALLTAASQKLGNVALTCFGWYLSTTADTQLIIALLQTLYIATRLLAEVRAEREQKARSWFASLTGGPTSMLQILAKHYASLGSYLYHHGILVVLLLGVSFIPIATVGSVVKHFAFPYQSQRSFLELLQLKPTKKRMAVTILARSALSVVVQLIITDVIRGLLWEAWRIAVAGVVIFSGTYLFMKKTSMLDSPTTKKNTAGGQPTPATSDAIADLSTTPKSESST